MTQRSVNLTTWLWCLLALQTGQVWSPVNSVTVKNPPKNPSVVEAQAKFFQDFFSVQLSPYKIEFGHVCEDPNNWEQRYEKKDFKNHRDMGKVRWGDKKGGYGEHYWDLNHAGHNNDHDHHHDNNNDDGSYHHDDSGDGDNYDHVDTNDAYKSDEYKNNDAYDEPSEQSPAYETDGTYDPEKASASPFDESGRSKRHYPRLRTEKRPVKEDHTDETTEIQRPRKYKQNKVPVKDLNKAASQTETTEKSLEDEHEHYQEDEEEEIEEPKRPVRKQKKVRTTTAIPEEQVYTTTPKAELPEDNVQQSYYPPRRQQEPTQFVPYERGAGLRQHYAAEQTAAPAPARLYLDSSTGYVVDRATGQSYALQPILV